MGVSGLLPLLRSIQRQSKLENYKGKTLGVDAYGWLHRGAIACANELALGKPTRKYVQYSMSRVNMLRHFGVTPYIVFDGDFLPSKAGTEASRARSREEHRKQGMEFIKAGKPSLASQEFQKCIDITPEMARHLIEELKKLGIAYVVAPYEADAQLTYLERRGLIDGIISEDSDLLVFGARCLITKLDRYGACVEINRRDFCRCREVSLTGWTDDDFRRMAILSGCDYLDGLKGMGLKTAYRYLRKHKTVQKVVQRYQLEGKATVSENYLPAFYQAEKTFLYQRVFCPEKRELVLLTEDPTGEAKHFPFIGAEVEPEMARAVAAGDVNPITKEPITVPALSPKRPRAPSVSIPPPPPTSRLSAPGSSGAGSKPINSYFKKHFRIPMGEMDRNCFAVDPQRVAEITHNGLVPRVFPLPRPYLDGASNPQRGGLPSSRLRRRTENIATTLSNVGYDQGTNRRHTTGPLLSSQQANSLPSSSSQPPPKKARLCAGEATPGDEDGVTARSKFFPAAKASLPEPSPVTSSPPKDVDDLLRSDDSIEEALTSIPDWDFSNTQPSKGRKSIQVYSDSQNLTPKQPDTRAKSAVQGDENVPSENPEMAPPPPPNRPASTPIRLSSTRISLDKFLFQAPFSQRPSGDVDVDTLNTPSSTASTAASSSSMVFTPLAGSSTSTPASSATSILTPLQRIGARALQRGPHKTPSIPMSLARPKRTSLDALPVNPAFVPLPKVDVREVAALNTPCGSEDQIPLFDDENEAEDEGTAESSGDVPRPGATLDLSRFLFR